MTCAVSRAAAPPVGDPLPEGALRRIGTGRLRHEGTVEYLAFLADGKTLASTASDGTARLWDVATGRELHRFRCPDRYVRTVAVYPRENLLACSWGGGTYQIGLFDLASGEEISRSQTYVGEAVSFLPDRKRLVCNGSGLGCGCPVRLCDFRGEAEELPLGGDKYFVTSVSADGTRLAVSGEAHACVWDLVRMKRLFEPDGAAGRQCVALSADGKLLAVSGDKGQVRLWCVETKRMLRAFDSGFEDVHRLALSPDGRVVAVSGGGADVRLWDA
jgi:WD40 repeat protein